MPRPRRLRRRAAAGLTCGLGLTLAVTLGVTGPADRTLDSDSPTVGLAAASTPARVAERRRPVSFGIATFNVLGAAHTQRRKGWASGKKRIRRAVKLLNWWDVGVAALQEFQEPQFRAFQKQTGKAWSTWPRLTHGPRVLENSVIWRRRHWRFEEGRTIDIPYFNGNARPMPVVLLSHRETGRRIWVTSFHNPTSNKKWGNHDRARWRALTKQGRLAKRLHRNTGLPVFILGDLNEREKAFCRVTRLGPLRAANGGSRKNRCRPPDRPLSVNWVFGTRDVAFDDYRRVITPPKRKISDHFLIRATATLDKKDGRSRWQPDLLRP